MATYTYKAQKKDGSVYKGEIDAEHKGDVYIHIRNEGGVVISVDLKKDRKLDLNKWVAKLNRVKEHEKIVFAKNLGSMIKAGLSLSRALSVFDRQTKNPKMKEVLQSLMEDVNKGVSLNEALAKHPKVFSKIFISMVAAGEESGTLSESLIQVSEQMEKMYLLKKKVRGAFMYPAIIISVMVIIAIIMLVYVVPTISSVFSDLNVELPLSTRFVIGLSELIRDNVFVFLGAIVALIIGAFYFFKTKVGKRSLDWSLLHFPIIGNLVKETNSARTARTMSSLLSSGIDVVGALDITRDVIQNSYYKDVLSETSKEVEKGKSISEIIAKHENLYPVFVAEMVSVGEETGKISDMFLQIATYYEEDVDQKTKDMSTIIEPFLMVVIGVAVGFFAISMLSPTYSLVEAF